MAPRTVVDVNLGVGHSLIKAHAALESLTLTVKVDSAVHHSRTIRTVVNHECCCYGYVSIVIFLGASHTTQSTNDNI